MAKQSDTLDLFLCHTGADKAWVEALGERVEAEMIDGRPARVFLDKWDIDAGENLVGRIDEGLRKARFLGVVLSPAMTKAPWPNAEWQSRFYSDPGGRDLRILPLLLHKFDPDTKEPLDLPMFLRPLKYLDFTKQKNFESQLAELLRILRGERPRRGRGNAGATGSGSTIERSGGDRHLPDIVAETLSSNLLPIISHPTTIWSDLTPARDRSEIWDSLRGKFVPPFALHAGRLYSFYSPDDSANPFRQHLSGADPKSERPVDWLVDADMSKMLVGLYNDALREHCFHLRIHTPEKAMKLARRGAAKNPSQPAAAVQRLKRKRLQFYCPMFDGKARAFRWSTGSRSRSLAKLLVRPDGTQFGVHKSARLKLTDIGGEIYLHVEPGWLFTVDGVVPLEGPAVTRFSTLWGGKERNKSVFTNILQWGLLLSEGQRTIEIALGSETLVVQAVPATADIGCGIESDVMDIVNMLGGDGAGEMAVVDENAQATQSQQGDDLDEIAAAVFGSNSRSNPSSTTDEANDAAAEDDGAELDDDDDSEELRLPF